MWAGVDNYYIRTLTNRYRINTLTPIDETGKSLYKGWKHMHSARTYILPVVTVLLFLFEKGEASLMRHTSTYRSRIGQAYFKPV